MVDNTLMRKLSGPAANGDLTLLHQDAWLLVFDKPSGLLSVPGRGPDKQDCASARAQAAFADARVVHRLDMSTSGLFVMARGAQAQSALSTAFAVGKVSKHYVAVVAGHLETPADAVDGWSLIDLAIAADWPRRPLRIIDPTNGKPSLTKWRVLPPPLPPATTRLLLHPLTGRTHQLRVHLQGIGHPIVGDALYAPPEIQALAPRLLLHASELAFSHPATGAPLTFSSEPPF
jgi:tRNA pseudouridine32 synthase/23S rRNA pseudouridine746 synthase